MSRRVNREDLGNLYYELRLAEIAENDHLAENIRQLIDKLNARIREEKKLDEQKTDQ